VRIGIVIQCRIDSTRLPGKSLMTLGGKTLIEHTYLNSIKSKMIDECLVAIPNSNENIELAEFLNAKSIPFIVGSTDDLISRHITAAEKHNLDLIVRIPGDNPLPHASEVDRIIDFHIKNNSNGFSTNLSEIFGSGYPDGIGAEIFSFESLISINQSLTSAEEKEHVHLNFLDYKTQIAKPGFVVKTVKCPKEFARPDIRLDINTDADFTYFEEMFNYFNRETLDIRDIIVWHDNRCPVN